METPQQRLDKIHSTIQVYSSYKTDILRIFVFSASIGVLGTEFLLTFCTHRNILFEALREGKPFCKGQSHVGVH